MKTELVVGDFSVGIDFDRSYEEYMRSRQAALTRQSILSRGYADLPFGKLSAPMPPPPPPASGTHKRNKRLLLCSPQ